MKRKQTNSLPPNGSSSFIWTNPEEAILRIWTSIILLQRLQQINFFWLMSVFATSGSKILKLVRHQNVKTPLQGDFFLHPR
jgi:hypothetical protein